MKKKTIKKVIRKKINDWLASIENEEVRELAAKNTIVTGGCITSMLLKEPVNDYDIYFKNYETALAVTKYYNSRFSVKNSKGIPCKIFVDTEKTDCDGNTRIRNIIKSAGVASEDGSKEEYQYFEGCPDEEGQVYVEEVMDLQDGDGWSSDIITEPGDIQDVYEETEELAQQDRSGDYRPVFLSTNAITLSGKIQIVNRFYGTPEEIHGNYDFVHCMNYWTSWDSKLVLKQEALEAMLARELTYVGSKYPVCSVIRLRKFIKRGWTVNAGQILKMCMQICDLDLHDPEVLEDQLTGVDAAYFIQLLTRLKEKDPEKIDTAYLVEIVDRLF